MAKELTVEKLKGHLDNIQHAVDHARGARHDEQTRLAELIADVNLHVVLALAGEEPLRLTN